MDLIWKICKLVSFIRNLLNWQLMRQVSHLDPWLCPLQSYWTASVGRRTPPASTEDERFHRIYTRHRTLGRRQWETCCRRRQHRADLHGPVAPLSQCTRSDSVSDNSSHNDHQHRADLHWPVAPLSQCTQSDSVLPFHHISHRSISS